METKEIINSLKNGFGCIEVYPGSHTNIQCYFYCDGNRIDENNFTWRVKKDGKRETDINGTPFYLELNEVSQQWYRKHKSGVLTVVVEEQDKGAIYQIGRHNKEIWEKHGVTQGYK